MVAGDGAESSPRFVVGPEPDDTGADSSAAVAAARWLDFATALGFIGLAMVTVPNGAGSCAGGWPARASL
jgi:hypothetical protein